MPADFFIDTRLGIVFSKATNVLAMADALDHMDRLERDPEFRPEFNQLIDFRQTSAVVLSHDEIRRLASRKIFGPRSRRAFVVPGDFEYGLARIFATYRDMQGESGIMIFRDMEKALAWLALSAEPSAALFPRLTRSASLA
jgi:hypothetical protein